LLSPLFKLGILCKIEQQFSNMKVVLDEPLVEVGKSNELLDFFSIWVLANLLLP
jgi:hypothetical protein